VRVRVRSAGSGTWGSLGSLAGVGARAGGFVAVEDAAPCCSGEWVGCEDAAPCCSGEGVGCEDAAPCSGEG